MEFNVMSILTLIIGIFIGTLFISLLNYFRGVSAEKKADKFLEEAKKEAEKQKRDRLLEIKEESYKNESFQNLILKFRKGKKRLIN